MRNKPFRRHGVSYWNPYERRISHLAILSVFNRLASFSFRLFRGLGVFNDLTPFLASPRIYRQAEMDSDQAKYITYVSDFVKHIRGEFMAFMALAVGSALPAPWRLYGHRRFST
jgi:purine-cytosine permease-like protein